MSIQDVGAQKPAPRLAARSNPRRAPARKIRVLIVDDIAENRVVLGVCCEQFGVSFEAVDSGREAVELVRSGRFDLVFMDILMPGMDGVAATRAIRALPGEAALAPIIAVTTAADPKDVLHYRANGFTDVVAKPINVARLMGALDAAVSEARRTRRSRLRHDRIRLTA